MWHINQWYISFGFRRTFNVYSGEKHETDNKIFTVKSHFSIGGAKMDVAFKNAADGREVVLDIRGDWLSRYSSAWDRP